MFFLFVLADAITIHTDVYNDFYLSQQNEGKAKLSPMLDQKYLFTLHLC